MGMGGNGVWLDRKDTLGFPFFFLFFFCYTTVVARVCFHWSARLDRGGGGGGVDKINIVYLWIMGHGLPGLAGWNDRAWMDRTRGRQSRRAGLHYVYYWGVRVAGLGES
ncbi:hypothetical protein B0T22DRAFT_140172 [Podospora appendiculata]|uniref:Uncharacterized protein n=1 Tax=Podospora appendiculata TaxID=314037 RepID=A0AAE0X8A7_9PEZI|nr:hypothetical protein B0T22DRAFT_140172 [Podospora appendiculata]